MKRSTTAIPEYNDNEASHPSNYDSQYRAETSNKVQILSNRAAQKGATSWLNNGDNMRDMMDCMVKSERTVMTGENRKESMRRNMRLLHFGFPMQENQHVGLTTTPRVLSMGNITPGSGDMATICDLYEPELGHRTGGLVESRVVSDEEITVLRHRMATVSRRLMDIEQENEKRSHRELIFYPIVVSYMLFQVASWFMRSNK